MKSKLTYTGELTQAAVEKFMSEQSKGCYVFYYVIFDSVVAYKTDKILRNNNAPSDYQHGFYKDGAKKQWSDKRKIIDQNTGIIDA